MCKLCETRPVYEFTNQRKLCAKCFVRYFQKKVLYAIRRFGLVKKGNVIGYKKSNSFRSVVLEDVLKMFAEKADIEIVKLPSKKKLDKIALDSTIDLCANEFVKKIINKNIKNLDELKVIDKKIIKPLYLFLDEEVLLYARIKRLKFKEQKKSKNYIVEFIDELEKKHPEIKRAIVNSFLKL